MRHGYIKDIDGYIDSQIDDAYLRCYDWQIAVYILTEKLADALAAKWRRVAYLQSRG